MSNWLLIALMLVAILGLGGLALLIDNGVADKYKQRYVYALFSLLGLIGVVFMMVEDKSDFAYTGWVDKYKSGGHREGAGLGGSGAEGRNPSDDGDASGSGADDGNGGRVRYPDGRDCEACPPMIDMAGGKTVIGTLFRDAGQHGPVLGPLFETEVKPYAISRTEITIAQYQAFVTEAGYQPASGCRVGSEASPEAGWRAPGFPQEPDHPVVCLAHADALAYTDWLTRKTGYRYALPTEVEWEHAARASTLESYTTGRQIYSGQANFRTVGSVPRGTVRAGSYAPNSYGLQDVHGNVAEMLADCWDEADGVRAVPTSTAAGAAAQPAGGSVDSACTARIAKGGSWQSTAGHLQFATRAKYQTTVAENSLGFRVVRREK